jgi:hypothetical protein
MIVMVACVPMMASEAEQAQQLCVNTQRAYEAGYNSGAQRQPLDTRWVDLHCAPEMREPVRARYLDGFHAGASNAPSVVAVPGGAPGGVAPPAQSCRFDRDCGGDGFSCRHWRGSQVCMGYGDAGDPCWFDSDCLSDTCNLAGGARTCN